MNEAFSDIWGACVEYYAAPSKSTWLIGEDIMKNGAAALRSMSDPKLKASLILTVEQIGKLSTVDSRF
jgi:Zn-dependent metalloprotease